MESGRESGQSCRNCGAGLAGEWCAACGERRLRPADRKVGALLREALEAATDWDGRLLGTLRALLFQPGRLGIDWIAGRRKRRLGPVALFLLANLAYFFAAPMSDFNLGLREQVEQPHRSIAAPLVERRLAERGVSFETYAAQYAAQSGNVSKSLLAWHVPWLALGLAALAGWRRWYVAEHVVVALHLFTFLLAMVLLLGWVVLPLLGAVTAPFAGDQSGLRAPVQATLLALLLAHWTLAVRRVYGFGWLRTLLTPVVLVSALAAGHFSYRFVQFLLVFALT